MPGELQRRAAEFRRDLLALERSAASDMVRTYGVAWRRVEARVTALWQEVTALREAGEVVPPVRLMQLDRYLRLQDEITVELRRFAVYADQSVAATQLAAVNMAQEHSPRLISAVASDAELAGLEQFVDFAHAPRGAIEALVGYARGNTPLGRLLDAIPNQVNGTVRDTLIAGLALGQNPRETARQVRRAFGTGLARALTISRTETLRAYREATRLDYAANDDILDGWVWSAACDKRTCVTCVTGDTVVSGPLPEKVFSRYYTGDILVITTASGKHLTITPNHPILTDRGWVKAGDLRKGNNVVCGSDSDRAFLGFGKDNYQVPTTIKEIAETFGVVTAEMESAAPDFHGDGKYSQVHTVRANSLLGNNGFPFGSEHFQQEQFGFGEARPFTPSGLFFPSFSGFDSFVPTNNMIFSGGENLGGLFQGLLGTPQISSFFDGSAFDSTESQTGCNGSTIDAITQRQIQFGFTGNISSGNLSIGQLHPAMSLSAALTTSDAVPLLFGAEQSPFPENLSEPFGTDAESGRKLLDSLARNISLDCILDIDVRSFRGHVYNLQTETGWYVSNGIITHNCWAMHGRVYKLNRFMPSHPGCRCSLSPQLKRAYRGNYEPERGPDLFARATPEIQRAVLGPGAYAEYQRGRVQIENFVSFRRSREWGVTVQRASLGTALERARGT